MGTATVAMDTVAIMAATVAMAVPAVTETRKLRGASATG
jgi:hypothetical protein